MRHHSLYLDWYLQVHKVKHDFRSSGIAFYKYNLLIREVDFSMGYVTGNPKTAKIVAQRYGVRPENVFLSSEGTSGQNARIIRYLAEHNKTKKEAIVECPTYEPLLRLTQEYFPRIKRLERKERHGFSLDADQLRKIASKKTALLVITNSHAPSGAISNAQELGGIMTVASEYGFHVVCDEIYAEFDRSLVPTVSSINEEYGIVTTSYTKAYGLGGLKLGVALASEKIVEELYHDVLNTVGNSPNIVQLIASELLGKGKRSLEKHKQKWERLKSQTEKWLKREGLDFFPNKAGVTYWIKTPIQDTYKWINEHAIPRYGVAPVPGAFFLFKNNYKLAKSNMVRLGLGNINPDEPNLTEGLDALHKAMKGY